MKYIDRQSAYRTRRALIKSNRSRSTGKILCPCLYAISIDCQWCGAGGLDLLRGEQYNYLEEKVKRMWSRWP